MAVIGQQLTTPESGWKRYDERDPLIVFDGSPTRQSYNSYGTYSGTLSYPDYASNPNNGVKFKFTGTKLIVGVLYWNTGEHSGFNIEIDGVNYGNFQTGFKPVITSSTVGFVKTDFPDGEHSVVIRAVDKSVYGATGSTFALDFIDIDAAGKLTTTVGLPLTVPDAGWRRFDNTYPTFNYVGAGWNVESNANHYGGSMHYNQTFNGTKITFEFVGSKLRFIGCTHTTHSASVFIVIDGETTQFSQRGAVVYSCLQFEKLDLAWGKHTVELYSTETYGVRLDAVDIDETGYLVTAENHPKTGGVLRTRISDMQVGDYIRCGYSAANGAAGQFYGLGISTIEAEIPRDGTTTPIGYFYFIKVKEGLLVADRVVQYGVSWITLNTSGYAQGAKFYDSLIPLMASNTYPLNTQAVQPNGEVSASSTYNAATYAPWKALDGVDSSWGWIMPVGVKQGWIEYRFYNPTVVRKYSLKAPSSNANSMPSEWRFEGWDGSDWVVLDSQTYTGWLALEEREYPVNNGRAYLKYRIFTLNNDGNASYTGLGEFRLGADPIKTKLRMLTGGIAYMGVDGYPSTTDQGLGMFPADNEWDSAIKDSPWDGTMWGYASGAIEGEWTQDTPFTGFTAVPAGFTNNGSGRTIRGRLGSATEYWSTLGTYTSPSKIGFRPVLEYSFL